jgi:hypothetical protein
MKKKKFDFSTTANVTTVVDCLECENYYTGACDAQAGGCNAYTPTRKIRMAGDIETIKRRLNIAIGLLALIGFGVCTIAASIL